jgi:hypothetical protein
MKHDKDDNKKLILEGIVITVAILVISALLKWANQ